MRAAEFPFASDHQFSPNVHIPMFRITPHQQLATALQRTQSQTARAQQIQSQISSGLRIQRASDDPAGHREVLSLERFLSTIDSDVSITQHQQYLSNQAHTQIRAVQQLIVQVRDVSLQARQATDTNERKALAAQVGGIREQLLAIGNTHVNGRYLFGGNVADAPPLQQQQAHRVHYVGGGVVQNSSADTLPTGLELFFPSQTPAFTLSGETGAQLGAGIHVGQGRNSVRIDHLTTLYQGGSGVQPGADTATGDSVLGALGTHQLHINDTSGTGASGELSLNGGPAVAFTASDTNLLVSGPHGEQVYVDTSAIAAGFNGLVDLEARGTIALDDGPPVDLTFAANQQLFNLAGDVVRYIDTTAVSRSGIDRLEPTQGADLFTTLNLLQEDILAASSPGDSNLDYRIAELERLSENVLGVLGRQSAGTQQLDVSLTRLADLKLALQERLANVQSADLVEAVLRLQEQQSQTEFSLSTAIRTFNISILDFLG